MKYKTTVYQKYLRASYGLSGKDDVSIVGGDFTIVSGKDGLHSNASANVTGGSSETASSASAVFSALTF